MKKDYAEMEYHPFTEKIVEAMAKKIPTAPKHMFRSQLCYYLCKVASTMRININTEIRGIIPINAFLFNLAPSGVGKNYSTTTLIEKNILSPFKETFLEQVLPIVAEENIAKIAVRRAYKNGEDPDIVKEGVLKEYRDLGQMRFSFSRATQAALQQLRQKLLIADAGAMSLEIDEIGLNLLATNEALIQYLELYDIGETKEAITKNTRENTRIEELEGATPANLLAFGTPCKVYDGGKVEENWMALNETGFARRSWHCYMNGIPTDTQMTGAEKYAIQADKTLNDVFKNAAETFRQLASIVNFKRKILLPKDVGIELLDYEIDCKKRAKPFIDSQEMIRAEMEHRYFKVLKFAGALAYIDGNAEITMDNLYAAIKLAEDSGQCFYNMMHQEPAYMKMARYIANSPHELTQADLIENLPYYKGTQPARRDMMTHSIAWGYKNHIVIRQYLQDGVEFFKGSTLEEVNLNKLKLAHSQDIADGYKNDLAPFNKLHILTQMNNHHWINHHTTNGHRDEEHMVSGFNLVVLDVDGGAKLREVHRLLQDYKFMTHTTKRHTPDAHRFRLIMPLNYEMSMNKTEYTAFMKNIFEWLPFEVDTGAIDRCRKWLTNDKGTYHYGTGETLLDARLFIPKTKKNDERRQQILDYASLSNLERWFVANAHTDENRNVQLHKYARVLVDLGYSYEDTRTKVMGLNSSLIDKLSDKEIDSTVMLTVTKAIAIRDVKQQAA